MPSTESTITQHIFRTSTHNTLHIPLPVPRVTNPPASYRVFHPQPQRPELYHTEGSNQKRLTPLLIVLFACRLHRGEEMKPLPAAHADHLSRHAARQTFQLE